MLRHNFASVYEGLRQAKPLTYPSHRCTFMDIIGCSIKALIMFIMAASLFSSCRVNFGSSGYTTVEPNKSDLVGTWVPDQATLEDMKKRGGYDSSLSTRLVLKSDGSLEIANMPDWWEIPSGTSQRAMISHSGSWSLDHIHPDQTCCWTIAVKYSNRSSFLNLLGNKPPHKIEIILGDPDSGNEMIFIKQASQ